MCRITLLCLPHSKSFTIPPFPIRCCLYLVKKSWKRDTTLFYYFFWGGGGGEKGRETKLTCLRIEALYLFSILFLLFVTTCNALVMISSLIGTVMEVPQAQRSKITYQTIENKQLNSFFQKVKAFI